MISVTASVMTPPTEGVPRLGSIGRSLAGSSSGPVWSSRDHIDATAAPPSLSAGDIFTASAHRPSVRPSMLHASQRAFLRSGGQLRDQVGELGPAAGGAHRCAMDLRSRVIVVDLGPYRLTHSQRLADQPAAEARQVRQRRGHQLV